MEKRFKPEDYSFYKHRGYKVKPELYISKPFEGRVHIDIDNHGDDFFYVEFIEFDGNPTPEEIEEIEKYTDDNLYQIIETCEVI